ncbi:GDSL-like Lipase/Acylhydrolase family protein [Andreprevotia lacus DSM 23236]|jgi:lysophospholipase L1-like esterase|uniref:GDSL-like Lipase/Acylhydrolase family protein n=1 Tax=Andreprevotia lacus DSM 23236 TaxID=1121001 RepID=A0A1W1XAV7_9NEIS|nr:SGNH/GDSL hydrolase family protein [Andreprevotia lacus]SMC20904.1 GDSL-like Lipase/Acylhydrolase family protein [Andreprevotia lacus DSM 23236]
MHKTLLALAMLGGLAHAADPASAPALKHAQVQSSGRVEAGKDSWRATWPGTVLTTRFDGSAIGFKIDDGMNSYVAEIDGKPAKTIMPARGERTIWLRDLPAGAHTLQLIKRTESPEVPGTVSGFALDGGHWLPAPAPARRQIEFIGDSWTAALASLSDVRECSWDKVRDTTDITQGFAVQVARHYGADWQINAMSGMGMNRNWDGNLPDRNYRTFYPRLLQNDAASKAAVPGWKPQVVVIGLGTNDFSAAIKGSEKWTRDSLTAAYKTGFKELVASVRQRYGDAQIIATAHYLWPDDALRPLIKQLVDEARAAGDSRISGVEYNDLKLTACQWHPDLNDHRNMAATLEEAIDGLKIYN